MKEQLTNNPNKKLADPHVFFAESTLSSERARSAFHTAVERRFASGDVFIYKKSGDLAAKQWTALEKVDKFAKRNESQLRLTDFDPPKNLEDVIDRLSRSKFLPMDHRTFKDYVVKSLTANRDYWRSEEGKQLTHDVNQLAYKKIQQEYGLSSPDEARRYFNESMNDANEAINGLVEDRLEEQKGTLALLDEATLVSSPARLIKHAMTSPSSKRERRRQYEVLRSLTIAELAAEIKQKAGNTKEHIDDFNSAITDTIFANNEDKDVELYVFYDKETGAPLWNSHLDGPLSQEAFDEYSETAILKRTELYTRDANGTVGLVQTNPRTKDISSTLIKMIREALSRKKLTEDDFIEPNGIADLGGIMSIVMQASTNQDQRVEDLIEMYRYLAKEHFGIGDDKIRVKDEKAGYTGQSPDHEFRRALFETQDGHSVEQIIVSLKNHLKNENQFATRDPQTNEPIFNGPAHLLYEKTRWIDVAKLLFPERIYSRTDWDKVKETSTQEAVEEITEKDKNIIPAIELPKQYIYQPVTEPALV